MPIEQLIEFHKKAIWLLEHDIKEIAQSTDPRTELRLKAIEHALDFHRRAVVVLVAAKQMFDKQPGLVEKAAAYDALMTSKKE